MVMLLSPFMLETAVVAVGGSLKVLIGTATGWLGMAVIFVYSFLIASYSPDRARSY